VGGAGGYSISGAMKWGLILTTLGLGGEGNSYRNFEVRGEGSDSKKKRFIGEQLGVLNFENTALVICKA